MTIRRNDGDEEHHRCCWFVLRHHRAARVKVGLKQREREGERERNIYVHIEYRTNKREGMCIHVQKEGRREEETLMKSPITFEIKRCLTNEGYVNDLRDRFFENRMTLNKESLP